MGKGDGTFGAPSFYSSDDFRFRSSWPISITTAISTSWSQPARRIILRRILPRAISTCCSATAMERFKALICPRRPGSNGAGDHRSQRGRKARRRGCRTKGSRGSDVFLGQGNGEFQALAPYSLNSLSGGPGIRGFRRFQRRRKMDVATVERNTRKLSRFPWGTAMGLFNRRPCWRRAQRPWLPPLGI